MSQDPPDSVLDPPDDFKLVFRKNKVFLWQAYEAREEAKGRLTKRDEDQG